MHGRGPCPAPCEAMRACACVPPWCSRFFGRETEETFFSHTNIKYFFFPVTLSAQTTYRHTPIHRPPNPADLSRTMESRGGRPSHRARRANRTYLAGFRSEERRVGKEYR